MDRDAPQPLTTEEAKARLRAAAQRASPVAWMQQRPWSSLATAAALGFMVSRLRLHSTRGIVVARLFGPMVMGMAVRRLFNKDQQR